MLKRQPLCSHSQSIRILLALLALCVPPRCSAFTAYQINQRRIDLHVRQRNAPGRHLDFFAASTSLGSSSTSSANEPLDNNGLGYYDPNQIHPKTKTLTESIAFFARLCLKLMDTSARRNRILKLRRQNQPAISLARALATSTTTKRQREREPSWKRNLRKLNEHRINLVKLADYTAPIVAPSFLFLTLGALMTSIIPHYYAECIQLVATLDPSPTKVWRSIVGLAVSCTLGALFTGLRGSLFWIAGSRGNYQIRVKLHRNLLLQEAAFFDSTETGYLLSRLNNDVNKIGQVISYHVNVVCRQLAQFIFGSVYLIRISPQLSLWAFGGIAIVAWISAVYGAFNRELSERVQDTFADATAVAETSFTMSETIRAFNGVEVDSAKYEAAQNRALELEETQAWGYGTHKFVSDTLQSILQALLLLACWRKGLSGGLQAAQLTTFMFYTNFVLESSNEVGDQWAKIQGAIGASTSVFDLIRRVPLVRDPPGLEASRSTTSPLVEPSTNEPKSANGERSNEVVPIIEMRNMTVTYGAMEAPALNQIRLGIYEGDRVAVVGRSGSGKSSMLRSILRFYDPSSGEIRLSGTSLKNMTRKELARRVAIVEQEPQLFPMTLLENVQYGIDRDSIDPRTKEPCYSDDMRSAAERSLRKAGLPVTPGNDLGLELDTRVGEGGRSLSGGQRQRVAIARALIRTPEGALVRFPFAVCFRLPVIRLTSSLSFQQCNDSVAVGRADGGPRFRVGKAGRQGAEDGDGPRQEHGDGHAPSRGDPLAGGEPRRRVGQGPNRRIGPPRGAAARSRRPVREPRPRAGHHVVRLRQQ
jgi:ABC-type multidrug transport system fused ATPase/permease subunit